MSQVPNQNLISIYLDPATKQWIARIGPDDRRGVQCFGATPCQGLGRLIHRIHGGKWTFDKAWRPDHGNGEEMVTNGAVPQSRDPVQAWVVRGPWTPQDEGDYRPAA